MSRSLRRCWVGFCLTVGLTGCGGETKGDAPAVVDAARRPDVGARVNPADGAEMVFIPPGEFMMGSDPDEIERVWRKFHWNEEEKRFTRSEQPAHRVRVDGFWMYRDNVTVARYRKFCEAAGRSMPEPPSWGWTDTHPIVNITWDDAKAYCSWAGGAVTV